MCKKALAIKYPMEVDMPLNPTNQQLNGFKYCYLTVTVCYGTQPAVGNELVRDY